MHILEPYHIHIKWDIHTYLHSQRDSPCLHLSLVFSPSSRACQSIFTATKCHFTLCLEKGTKTDYESGLKHYESQMNGSRAKKRGKHRGATKKKTKKKAQRNNKPLQLLPFSFQCYQRFL